MPGNRRMWDIGNTTVRNPERLRDALRVFKETIDGHTYNNSTQSAYWRAMRDDGVLESQSADGDWTGRKFLAALIQLGFVHRDSKRRLSITPVGQMLLDHPDLESRIMFRQLIKYQVSSPIEQQNLLRIRPFVLILQVLKLARERGLGGLNRDEIAAFLIPTLADGPGVAAATIERVTSFRAELAKRHGPVAKRQYVREVLEAAVPEGRLVSTIVDYADSSMRYARLTGAVTLSASGGRFVLSQAHLDEVLEILDNLPLRVADADYVAYLHNAELPELPLDDPKQATGRIEALRKGLASASHVQVPDDTLTAPIPDTKTGILQELFTLETLSRLEQEAKFYRQQRSRVALEEIRTVLVDVQSSSAAYGIYGPAMLEWALWRLHLAINDIEGQVSETRGFAVDDDFNPINHAVPNRADAAFPYQGGDAIVVEATLSGGPRQVATEGEPVRRHVAQYMAKNRDMQVRSLFVAPRIDPNTYNEFYRGSYEIDEEDFATDIVPLTIDDVVLLIDRMLEEGRIIEHSGLLRILDGLLALRDEYGSAREWRSNLPEHFKALVEEVVPVAPPLPAS